MFVGGEAVVHVGQQLLADDDAQVIGVALHLGLIGFQAGKGLLGGLIHEGIGVRSVDIRTGDEGEQHAGHQTQHQGDLLEHGYSLVAGVLAGEDWL